MDYNYASSIDFEQNGFPFGSNWFLCVCVNLLPSHWWMNCIVSICVKSLRTSLIFHSTLGIPVYFCSLMTTLCLVPMVLSFWLQFSEILIYTFWTHMMCDLVSATNIGTHTYSSAWGLEVFHFSGIYWKTKCADSS